MGTLKPLGDQARASSSELLEMLLDVMPDAAVVVESTGEIVAVNRQAEELFGYPASDLAGKTIEMLVPDRFRHRHRGDRTAYGSDPRVRAMGAGLRLAGRRRDGSEFPVDISLAPLGGPDRTLVVAAIRDRSQQEAAMADLAQLAAIVSSSSDAIFSIAPQGSVTTWNPGATRLFDYEPEEIIGEHISRLFPPGGSTEFEELLAAVMAFQDTAPRDIRWMTKTGHPLDVAISVSPMNERGGLLLGISVMARDIAERKQAEALLRREERVQAVTSEVRLSMLSNSKLEDTFALICARVDGIVDVEGTLLAVVEGDAYKVAAGAGVFAAHIGLRLDETAPVIRAVPGSKAGDVVSVAPADLGDQLAGRLSPGIRTMLAAPLPSGRGPLGMLISVGPPDHLGARELPIIEALAGAAALALELAVTRQAREHLLLAADRERIGRDLHDLVIQRLFGTGITLQGVAGLITDERAADRVSAAVDDLDATIREIRTTIFALEAPKSADGGLRADILRLVAETSQSLGFEPSVHFDGPIDSAASDDLKAQVLAVAREALSNTCRHARASQADISLRADDHLDLVITDNGIGIGHPKRESGLANLRNRAGNFDGTLTISDASGGGTRIQWRVPIRAV